MHYGNTYGGWQMGKKCSDVLQQLNYANSVHWLIMVNTIHFRNFGTPLYFWKSVGALALLVEHQQECQPVKHWVMRCWHGYPSIQNEVKMICMWSSWCHCHPINSCFITIQNDYIWWQLSRLFWKNDHKMGVCILWNRWSWTFKFDCGRYQQMDDKLHRKGLSPLSVTHSDFWNSKYIWQWWS